MEAYRSMLDTGNGNALLIIDPQNDFHPGGSLAIPTAGEDANRIAELINKLDVDEIYVTLDSHTKYHIAHPLFWVGDGDTHPTPFTKISWSDVKNKVWRATQPKHQKWAEQYVATLDKAPRFDLTIWPEHCRIGTPGHAINPVIAQALAKWEEKKSKPAHIIMKGNNALTEHYSAFKAEVALKEDPNTLLNEALINQLKRHEFVFICGQAKSHCVNWSTRDLESCWKPKAKASLVLIEDGMSPVPGFEKESEEFVAFCDNAGLQTLTTKQALAGEYKKADITPEKNEGLSTSTSQGQSKASKIIKSAESSNAKDPITTAVVLTGDGPNEQLVQTYSKGSLEISENALISSVMERRNVAAFKLNKGNNVIAKGKDVRGVIGVRGALLAFVKDVHKANGTLTLNAQLLRSEGLALFAIERRNMHLTVVNLNEEEELKQMKYYLGFAIADPDHPRLKGGYYDRVDLEYAAGAFFWKRFM